MIAVIEGRFAYSLALGMLAAINPCGFVMLPAYLMYFLGLQGTKPGSQRASVSRALVVSAATSAGFILVFLIVGTISRVFTTAVQDNAKYVSLVVGIAVIIVGCLMLAGWRPKFALPEIGGGKERSMTFVSMFGFGVAYAVASIGCGIPLLIAAVLGSFSTHGFVSGVICTALYGVGMALMVTALTVTLAFASGGLLRVLRGALQYMDRVAAVFLIATGMYLTWYWYSSISDRNEDGLTSRVLHWQGSLQDALTRVGFLKLAGILAVPVVIGVVYLLLTRRSGDGSSHDSAPHSPAPHSATPQHVDA
ncbi:MAG: putative cytochrome c biosis protein [Ilumatobacteraceae bacterium]|nr:putative cytochrome c biosis protein [Ilumatobacteraceae bacterium]